MAHIAYSSLMSALKTKVNIAVKHKILLERRGLMLPWEFKVLSLKSSTCSLIAPFLVKHQDEIEFTEYAPEFIQELKASIVDEGEDVVLECKLSGQPEPSVKW